MTQNFQNNIWFVTGATGLVGSTIVKKLRETGSDVIALVRKDSSKKKVNWLLERGVQVVVGDLLDIDSFKYYLGTCDIVVHAAAAVQVYDKKTNNSINVQGTINIVKAMMEFSVRRIIHISTVGVYGGSHKQPVVEGTKTTPIGNYSKSKLAAEKQLLEFADKLDITIFRPPYIIGSPTMDRHVLPSLYKLLQRRFFPRIWRRDPRFGFVHARDIASAVVLAGSLETTSSRIYNIQSFDMSYSDLLEIAKELFNIAIIAIPIPVSVLRVLAFLTDLFSNLFHKNFALSKRLRNIEHCWTFSTEKLERELAWTSQYKDENKLFFLLSQFDKNNMDIDINTIDILVEID